MSKLGNALIEGLKNATSYHEMKRLFEKCKNQRDELVYILWSNHKDQNELAALNIELLNQNLFKEEK